MNDRVNELFTASESMKDWFVANWPSIQAAFEHPDIQKVAKESGLSITDPRQRLARLDKALVPFRGSFVEVKTTQQDARFKVVAEMAFLSGKAFSLLLNAATEQVVPEATVKKLKEVATKIDELGSKEAPWLFEGVDDGDGDSHDSEEREEDI